MPHPGYFSISLSQPVSSGLLIVCTLGLSTAVAAAPPSTDALLLERRYDRVSVLMTHNSMSNRAEGWLFPNQNFGLTRQLNDGVRGLMLDVHLVGDRPFLVHGKAFLGKRPLVDGLKEIGRFLKKSPQAVVTIMATQYSTVNLRMQRLEPAFHHFRKARVGSDVLNGNACGF